MSLLPPFFGGLMSYDAEANVAFACPGHQGGQFYRKSPAGQLFFKHFGESIFRNDLCNADVELGDLLIHEGAAARGTTARGAGVRRRRDVLRPERHEHVQQGRHQRAAAAWRSRAVRSQQPQVDSPGRPRPGRRDSGLPADRAQAFGMIGAVDWDAWDEDVAPRADPDEPARDRTARHQAERPFRLACIQLATYDGTIYNVRKVLEKIGHLCEYVLWDEAWIGYNAFHPLFDDHSPMRLEARPEMPGLFSTQSVHKQVAGFSQASQIHKRDEHIRGQRRFVDHKRFNESFLMNASTSPFYPLFASLDVNAKIHEGKAGEMLWDRCIELGIEARKKLREFGRYYARTGDERGGAVVLRSVRARRGDNPRLEVHRGCHRVPGKICRRMCIKREQQCWKFAPESKWHGYAGYAEGYAMVDPSKLTLLTPGIDRQTGEYLDFGVPATMVANYLREQRVVPEKCDLNSILFLMTPAEDESKLNTLIAKLVSSRISGTAMRRSLRFCRPSARSTASAMPSYTLRRICNEMHDFYRTANVKELQRRCFRASSFPELAMSPKDAYEALVANDVDYVPLERSRGASRQRSR